MSLSQRLKEKAFELGFDLIGLAPAERAPHAEAYHRWLEQGYQAGMAWLARESQRRADPRLLLPGVRSVVVVGLSYFVLNPPAVVQQHNASLKITSTYSPSPAEAWIIAHIALHPS